MHKFDRGKSSPQKWATSVFFETLSKGNGRPMGENSPNLVTQALITF
jgi:hypothetical protein